MPQKRVKWAQANAPCNVIVLESKGHPVRVTNEAIDSRHPHPKAAKGARVGSSPPFFVPQCPSHTLHPKGPVLKELMLWWEDTGKHKSTGSQVVLGAVGTMKQGYRGIRRAGD